MKNTELRIGNYVKYRDKSKMLIVSNIGSYGFETVSFNLGLSYGSDDLSEYNGIPLNEEWLLRFGFIEDGLGDMWIDLMTHWLSLRFADGFYYPLYAQLPEMSHEDEQIVGTKRINYVHQLQNLYFALTGEELTL